MLQQTVSQPNHTFYRNFISMNLLQMPCVVTQDKKISFDLFSRVQYNFVSEGVPTGYEREQDSKSYDLEKNAKPLKYRLHPGLETTD